MLDKAAAQILSISLYEILSTQIGDFLESNVPNVDNKISELDITILETTLSNLTANIIHKTFSNASLPIKIELAEKLHEHIKDILKRIHKQSQELH
jgi:hypothetical protein